MAMKNVEVITSEIIEHKGIRYTKVCDDELAKKGDVIQRNTTRLHWFTKDAFYKIKLVDSSEIVQVKDDEGDLVMFRRDNGVLFRKVSKQKAPVLTKAEKEIEFEGEKYRKVERKAQAGDVVVFTFDTYKKGKTVSGKPYATKDGSKYTDDGGVSLLILGWNVECPNPDVYEKVEAEHVPQDGDIVVVISNKYGSRNSVGDIGKITKVKSYGIDVEVPSKPSSSSSYGNCHAKEEVRKATPAEVEEYEKQLHKVAFSVGDYVKIVKSYDGNSAGDIVKITEIGTFKSNEGLCEFIIEDIPVKRPGKYAVKAEQVVKATEEEAKWAKIGRKVGEFKTGDIVNVLAHIDGKKVGELGVVEDGGKLPERGIGIRFYDGIYVGICLAEENAELIAPVESTFK